MKKQKPLLDRNYCIAPDQFEPWWPNLCVMIERGAPMPVTVSSAKAANEAIRKMMEVGK